MEKPLKIRLHVLSPIHIGCDDVYEPTNFVIDENRRKLIEFDPLDFIKRLSPHQRAEFSRICSGDNLLSIFKFIKQALNHEISGREINIASGLSEHYKKVLSMSSYDSKVIINQFTLNKTAYNPQTKQVYIPGTSIKGAIRTAYLSHLAINMGKKNAREKANDLEKELLGGSFDADPFRMIKVSDFQPIEKVNTKIVYGVNKKKRISDRATRASAGPLQIFEVIESGGIFEGVMNVGKPEKTSGIKIPVEQTILLKAIHQHYNKLYTQEVAITKECGFRPVTADLFSKRFGDSCFLVRIGRHSGAEAVTIEGNRNIKIMQGKKEPPQYLNQSTTIWLASETARPEMNNGLTPFGWAVLEILPFDAKERLFSKPTKISSKIKSLEKQEVKQKEINLEKPEEKKQPEQRLISNALLIYSPGNRSLSTTVEGKKAFVENVKDEFVPGHLWPKLKKDKKIKASIIVEPQGNAFKIIKIEG